MLAAVAWAAPTAEPTQVVQKLNDALLGVLKESEALGYQGRYQRLTPILGEFFDLDYMARAAVGRHWKKLTPEQQARWVDTFKQLTSSTYAGRLQKFSGQQFETLGSEPASAETVLVHSRVIDPGGENVDLNYRLRSTPSGWKVIDVYLKGTVSELALRRSEYAAVLKREGFDALIRSVNEKITGLAAGTVKQ